MSRILLISDNKKQANEIASIVSKHGMELVFFASEEEIFKAIKSHNLDLIFVDTSSKKLDIHNILRRIKLQTQTKNIQTILIVKHENTDVEVLKFGNSYLCEPIDENILMATINSSLQSKSSLEVLSKNNL